QYNKIIQGYQLNSIMQNAFNKETKTIDEKKFLAEAGKFMTKGEAQESLLKVKMTLAFRMKKIAEYEKLALSYYKDGNDEKFSSAELNEVAWNFFENITEKSSLIKAVSWAEQSIKKNEEYANLDTLANLYFKIGDKVNAKLIAEKALEIAEKSGEDAASTKELLKKL
ncbi:MAG: thiol:disulfide interchange protein, partial [Bacteroidetes bacterium]|nr:thiol:disulfide interchange protein [Bacteroidota bacterium]